MLEDAYNNTDTDILLSSELYDIINNDSFSLTNDIMNVSLDNVEMCTQMAQVCD